MSLNGLAEEWPPRPDGLAQHAVATGGPRHGGTALAARGRSLGRPARHAWRLLLLLRGLLFAKCDVKSAYQAAHAVKAFIIKYPNRPLPGTLVPKLCAALPVRWDVPSDNGRCKRAEKFLRLLCALGVVKVLRKKHWHGPGHPSNEATIYGLPQDKVLEPEGDVGRRWYVSSWTRRQGQEEREPDPYPETTCIYSYGPSRFTPADLEAIGSEVERLSRAWSPKFHSSG